MPRDMHWVGTWATAPAPAEGVAFSNQTLRMNARVSIGGARCACVYPMLRQPAADDRPAHIGLRARVPGSCPAPIAR